MGKGGDVVEVELKERKYSIQKENVQNSLLKDKIDSLVRHYNSNEEMRDAYVKDISLIETGEHYVVEVAVDSRESLSHGKLYGEDEKRLFYVSGGSYPGGMSHVMGGVSNRDIYHKDKSLEEVLSMEYTGSTYDGNNLSSMFFCTPTNVFYETACKDNLFVFNEDDLTNKLEDFTQDLFGLSAKQYVCNNLKDVLNTGFSYNRYSSESISLASGGDKQLVVSDGVFKSHKYYASSLTLKNQHRHSHEKVEELQRMDSDEVWNNKLFPFREGVDYENRNSNELVGFLNLALFCANKYLKFARNSTAYAENLRHCADGVESGNMESRSLSEKDLCSFLSEDEILEAESSGIKLDEKPWIYSPEGSEDGYGIVLAVNSENGEPLRFGDASVIMSKGRLGKESDELGRPRVLHVYRKNELEEMDFIEMENLKGGFN